QAVGGFDERLFASEEIRLSKKLKRWGRRNNIMCFKILIDTPVLTSARKLQWYSGPKMLGWVIFMLFVPISVRSRKLCGFWYKRPNDASASR
ncbi:MAG: glycosyl transferase family 2, partial [Verrucomicrobiota bacterium]|nr:glycosyl transferase family 2 [Verrucomicrobiota bacterium]